MKGFPPISLCAPLASFICPITMPRKPQQEIIDSMLALSIILHTLTNYILFKSITRGRRPPYRWVVWSSQTQNLTLKSIIQSYISDLVMKKAKGYPL